MVLNPVSPRTNWRVPHGRLAPYRLVDRRVGVHGLLADHDGAGQQRGECVGEVALGQAVGVRHQVVRPGLLVDLVRREPAEAGHDLGRGGRADRLLHIGRVTCEKLFDGFHLFDHGSMRARATDNPRRCGARRVESA
jgi:hypothetical protein